jgi:alcohol dehydrogenase class IV
MADRRRRLPKFVTATTGFDVFCHAFESTLHPNSGAYINLMAWEAISLVAENLPQVLINPKNVKLREKMAWADTLAGLCIASAGVTLPHGMGMAIGGMYPHVAHGESLAIVYPACSMFTADSAREQHAKMAKIFNPELNRETTINCAEASSEAVTSFLKKINLHKGLKDVNMPEAEIESLAKQCMVLPDYKGNPRVASEKEMIQLVEDSYEIQTV